MLPEKLMGENNGGCFHDVLSDRLSFDERLNLAILLTLTPCKQLRYYFIHLFLYLSNSISSSAGQ
jgi:hypothetical protein